MELTFCLDLHRLRCANCLSGTSVTNVFRVVVNWTIFSAFNRNPSIITGETNLSKHSGIQACFILLFIVRIASCHFPSSSRLQPTMPRTRAIRIPGEKNPMKQPPWKIVGTRSTQVVLRAGLLVRAWVDGSSTTFVGLSVQGHEWCM